MRLAFASLIDNWKNIYNMNLPTHSILNDIIRIQIGVFVCLICLDISNVQIEGQ